MDIWIMLQLSLNVLLLIVAIWTALSDFTLGVRLQARPFIYSGLGLSLLALSLLLRFVDPSFGGRGLLVGIGLLLILATGARTRQLQEHHGLTLWDRFLFRRPGQLH